jgi:hypothetical protein
MNLVTIITTRSKSCSVKTLHAILRLNVRCLQRKINNEVCYVTDDPYEKAEVIQKYMKTHDRIVFIDFGIGMDDASLDQIFEPHDTIGCLVFPGVKEGVDWDMFKTKIRSGSKEPTSQMGLHFDTEVGKKISDNIYNVLRTEARVWMMNTKNVLKIIKDKKTGNCKIHPKMFEQFSERGVRTYAFTASKLTATYTHECVSNILNAAGVKVN